MPWTDETLEAGRVRLRAFRESDKPVIVDLASSKKVRDYLAGPLPAAQLDAIRQATVGERWGAFCVADRESDVAFGTVSFGRDRGELEVSYELVP